MSSPILLKMQFHGTRKEDQETIESYVTKLKSIANSLAEINNPVSDQDLVLQLLAGLPSQYLLLKNTISSRFPLPKFLDACSMLYEYEKSLPPPPPPKKENETNSVSDDEDHKEQNTNDPRGVGGEQSYTFFTRENLATTACLLSSVCTIIGAIPMVAGAVGAVGAVGASRMIVVGAVGAVALVTGWKIWQSTPQREKNE